MGTLTIKQCEQLAPLLRKVVAEHDKNSVTRLCGMFASGICMAVDHVAGGSRVGYRLVDTALTEMQPNWDGGYLDCDHHGWARLRGWEQRAFMCCLMAHWCEDRIAAEA